MSLNKLNYMKLLIALGPLLLGRVYFTNNDYPLLSLGSILMKHLPLELVGEQRLVWRGNRERQ